MGKKYVFYVDSGYVGGEHISDPFDSEEEYGIPDLDNPFYEDELKTVYEEAREFMEDSISYGWKPYNCSEHALGGCENRGEWCPSHEHEPKEEGE